MGVWGLKLETDRISEPRMIQGSPLKINRQTALHWSRLFISASLCGPSSAQASVQSPTHKARSAPIAPREILFASSLFPAYQVIIVTLRGRNMHFLKTTAEFLSVLHQMFSYKSCKSITFSYETTELGCVSQINRGRFNLVLIICF